MVLMNQPNGTGERASHADVLAALSVLAGDAPAPFGLEVGHAGVVIYTAGRREDTEQWAAALGLPSPTVIPELVESGTRRYRNWQSVGRFMGWRARVWFYVDEPAAVCPCCGKLVGKHEPAETTAAVEPLPHRQPGPTFNLGPLTEAELDHPDPLPGEADAVTSAAGAPLAAGAPAHDPDSPPYASPYRYRAEVTP